MTMFDPTTPIVDPLTLTMLIEHAPSGFFVHRFKGATPSPMTCVGAQCLAYSLHMREALPVHLTKPATRVSKRTAENWINVHLSRGEFYLCSNKETVWAMLFRDQADPLCIFCLRPIGEHYEKPSKSA